MFRYRKLYVDLVSENGEVCVGYATWLSLGRFELRSAGFERYTPEGERRVERARGPARVTQLPGRVQLAFETVNGPFALELHAAHAVSTEPQPLTPHLSWQVLAGSAEARLTLGQGERLSGAGYADYVEMTRPPRALGLRTVEWGRGHVGAEGFVFTRATFRNGSVFASALANGQPCVGWQLHRRADAGVDVELAGVTLALANERILHEGSALDAARFPQTGERLVARLCSGDVEETRWLARATFASGASAWALHEHVRLG
jgi:hypothetical protein